MKKKRNVLSIILCIALVVSQITMTGFAMDGSAEDSSTGSEIVSPEDNEQPSAEGESTEPATDPDPLPESNEIATREEPQIPAFEEGTYEWYTAGYTKDTFVIGSSEELVEFSSLVNGTAKDVDGNTVKDSFRDKIVSLSAKEIDLTGEHWIPIGKEYNRLFEGTFQGNGASIKGLYIESKEQYLGFFGYVKNATIKDLTVEGEILSSATGHARTAGICGYSNGTTTFDKCINRVTITGKGNYIGGICGESYNKAIFKDCVNEANLETTGRSIGGILGQAPSSGATVERCQNTGDIKGNSNVGGLVGYFQGGTLENSWATGSVTSSANSCGGLTGYSRNTSKISSSFYYNEITPRKISGSNAGILEHCIVLKADSYLSGYGGEEKSENSFLHQEAVYILNGRSEHRTVWEQGDVLPVLAVGKAAAICRVKLASYATQSVGQPELEANAESIFIDAVGNPSLYVKSGSKVKFTVGGEGIAVRDINDVQQTATDGVYSVTANDDILLLYGTEEEFRGPTIFWYDPVETEFTISQQGQLQGLAELVNGETAFGAVNFSKCTVNLGQSIHLNDDAAPWIPVGTQENAFKGTFDGKEFLISGLSIGTSQNPTEDGYQGLFGNSEGTIQNLAVSGSVYSNGDYAGGICGYSKGTIENCEMTGGSVTGKDYVGGLAGFYQGGAPQKAINQSIVTGVNYVGGLYGRCEKDLTKKDGEKKNSGTVVGSGNYVGGICGYATSSITSAENTGIVMGEDYIGGICGYSQGDVREIHSVSNLISGKNYVGGICGYSKGTVSGTAERPTVKGTVKGDGKVGGVCGCSEGSIEQVIVGEGSVVMALSEAGGIAGEFAGESITAFGVFARVDSGDDSGRAVGLCKDGAAVERGFHYDSPGVVRQDEMKFVGKGAADQRHLYYLAEAADQPEAMTAQQFANGQVAWLLDGGEEPAEISYWTQNKGDACPSLGEEPILRVKITRTGDMVGNNAVVLSGGIGPVPVEDNVQIGYARKGQSLSFAFTLDETPELTYETVFIAPIKLTQNEELEGHFDFVVNENYQGEYHFVAVVTPAYDWYLTPEEENIYTLTSENDLKGFSNLVDGLDLNGSGAVGAVDFSGKTVQLAQSIQMISGIWNPIGKMDTPFAGTFDGNGNSISGMQIFSVEEGSGLFGEVKDAVIKNLTAAGSIVAGGDYVGGIVGKAKGQCTFENLTFGIASDEAAGGTIENGMKYTGGVIGGAILTQGGQTLTIKQCTNLETVRGTEETAGILGGLTSSPAGVDAKVVFESCQNSGTIVGTDYVAGITSRPRGEMQALRCYNEGTVSGQQYVGGIAGYGDSKISIVECGNREDGNVSGASYVGGIVGQQNSSFKEIKQCFNAGTVEGTKEYAGGIAGYVTSGTAGGFTNNNNSGEVVGKDYVGGILGYSRVRDLTDCGNRGSVEGFGNCVGGIVGKVDVSGCAVLRCYNTGGVKNRSKGVAGGITGENSYDENGFIPPITQETTSYVKDSYNAGTVSGKGATGSISGSFFDQNQNCYTTQKKLSDKRYASAISDEQIKSGELAYLLDQGGEPSRTTYWSQGADGYPIAADEENNSVYKVAVSVSGKGSLTRGDDKITGQASCFLTDGSTITLVAEAEAGQKLLRLKINGVSRDLAAGNSVTVTIDGSDQDVLAIFADESVDPGKVVLSFDANGGQFKDGDSVKTVIADRNEAVNEPGNPVKAQYTFIGWFTEKTGGQQVTRFLADEDTNYYAQYEKAAVSLGEGQGTQEDPYLLSGAEDFHKLAALVNSGELTCSEELYFKVKEEDSEIVLDNWDGIGTSRRTFSGNFDGNGAKIVIDGDRGLFGTVTTSTLENFSMDISIVGSGGSLGGVVNYLERGDLTFRNITVNGSISGTSSVGGFLGGTNNQNYDIGGGTDLVVMEHCVNHAEVYDSGPYAGGLVGTLYAHFELRDCANTGDITGMGAGGTHDVEMLSCVGGMAGWCNTGVMERCWNSGNITGRLGGVSGLLGCVEYYASNDRIIRNCYNTGNISGKERVAGIVSTWIQNSSGLVIVENCYNTGTLSGEAEVGQITSDSNSVTTGSYVLGTEDGDFIAGGGIKTKTAAQFASGEVAYLLDGGSGVRSGIWTQDAVARLPALGQPPYYKLSINGNDGRYATTITCSDDHVFHMEDGTAVSVYSPLQNQAKISVQGKTVNVTEGGKEYRLTYKLSSIQLTQGETVTDITETKSFDFSQDTTIAITVSEEREEIVHKPGGGSGSGGGTGNSGTGQGQGSGTQGTPEGTGNGTGTEPGNTEGTGTQTKPSDPAGGKQDQSSGSNTALTESTDTVQTLPSVELQPETEVEDETDQEAMEALNSGGLEEGSKEEGENEPEEEQQEIQVWQIVRKTIAENPLLLLIVMAALIAVVVTGGIARVRKNKKQ